MHCYVIVGNVNTAELKRLPPRRSSWSDLHQSGGDDARLAEIRASGIHYVRAHLTTASLHWVKWKLAIVKREELTERHCRAADRGECGPRRHIVVTMPEILARAAMSSTGGIT
jgi:hypothetical protein